MIVYIVTAGSYSDYGIVAVYDEGDRVEADKTALLIGGAVEEWIVGELRLVDPGMDFYMLEVCKDGTVKGPTSLSRLDLYEYKKHESFIRFRTHKDDPKWNRKSHWRVIWYGYAKSQEHAIRSANEVRRQILAGQRPEGVDMGKN